MFGAPHLVGNKVVAQSIQTAGDVGQTQSYLYEQADPGPTAAVLNDVLVHLELNMEYRETSVGHISYVYENNIL